MEEQLISYKTAAVAKHKGFNEPCQFWFPDWSTQTIYDSLDHGYSQFPERSELVKGYGDITLAPTQSLLQKWLREFYKIHIEIELTDNTKYFHFSYIIITSNDRNYYDSEMIDEAKTHVNSEKFSTYEEALEEGLYEALKLVKC